ncbi:hypothetical protein CERSUDRAFT_96615 [Gelatoporia subvermispora B]|uniref:Uncharacterized protein n=1 Tax=Ceriporiopsis subvermispora (strain B) TaxID=914234 RepID=M2PHH2_CERS8|nr:hypothetical protein CERSUDRAFT_96615 [Gelatoporia subvermispora B]
MSHIPGSRPAAVNPGGNGRLLVLGTATVMSGLVMFYFAQFRVQGLRERPKLNGGEMTTWQFRHAQQIPTFLPANHGPPLADTMARQAAAAAMPAGEISRAPTPANSSERKDSRAQAIVAATMGFVKGKELRPDEDPSARGRVEQPAPPRRFNAYGIYGKHPDWKDGNK